jgi:transcriptional repressor NrdR
MKCPFCGSLNDKVVDSRPAEDGKATRRRRRCLSCERKFTTYEYIEKISLMIKKLDGTLEAYSRGKLSDGIILACKKRPVSRQRLETLVDEVENELFNLSREEVSSQQIGDLVLDKLKQIDEVAYVRFASVYRNFKSKDEFLQELKSLPSSLLVTKANGRVEPFERRKLLYGIELACNKRPVTKRKMEAIADGILRELDKKGIREVTSSRLGEMVMERLKKLDVVAYVRFASVYRKFKEPEEFRQELEGLKK